MKALIKDNKVHDVVENEFPVTDEFTWVDCDDTIKQGFSYDAKKKTFASNLPTAEELAATEARKQADVDLRTSAKAKLVAGEALTEEEASTLVGVQSYD